MTEEEIREFVYEALASTDRVSVTEEIVARWLADREEVVGAIYDDFRDGFYTP